MLFRASSTKNCCANQDSLNANVEAARAAVRSADEAIKVDAAAIESAKVELSYCYIRSPIDGRAGQRLVDIGNVVNPGGSGNGNSEQWRSAAVRGNALLVIERLDPIYADFTISQNNLTAVQQQMRAGTLKTEVRLPDTADDPVIGQLTFLDNAVQNTTGTGQSARDDSQCRTSLLARPLRQHSSRVEHDSSERC